MQQAQRSPSKTQTRSSRASSGRWSALAAAVMLSLSSGAFATASPAAPPQGIKAFRLCTGSDNLSHVIQGTLDQTSVANVSALNFKETPAHARYDWHPAPQEQYVITLSGTLEFSTTGGENFILHPGEVLLAQDITGPGHRWKLIDDQPWRRAYILTQQGSTKGFTPKEGSYDKGGCQA